MSYIIPALPPIHRSAGRPPSVNPWFEEILDGHVYLVTVEEVNANGGYLAFTNALRHYANREGLKLTVRKQWIGGKEACAVQATRPEEERDDKAAAYEEAMAEIEDDRRSRLDHPSFQS
jgi:hypothetical protein